MADNHPGSDQLARAGVPSHSVKASPFTSSSIWLGFFTRRVAGSKVMLPNTTLGTSLILARPSCTHSRGRKIYGEREWLDQKYGFRSRQRWRKLHVGIDAVTDKVVTSELTADDVVDVSEMPALLD